MVKNAHSQSGDRTLKLAISQELTDGMNWYFACLCKLNKAKSYFNNFWGDIVRNCCGHLGHETLKSAVSKEWVYEFFACWFKFTYIKSWSKIFLGGHGQKCAWSVWSQDSDHRTLKSTVSQELTKRMNWYSACCCKFKKAKSYFSDFWVGMVRNWCGRLGHETLKSAVSKEWVYEFSRFFACWLWCSNFWLNQHHILSLWLTNVSLLQLYLLDPKQ